MTDIVYLLGGGSLWKNNEMRYSLRSVEKHLKNVGNVFSIGHCPDLTKGITHISFPDLPNPNINKAVNIKNKIMAAVNDERISDDFLVFSDDYFLNKDFDADAYPYFQRGTLEEGMKPLGSIDLYRRVYGNTIEVLKKHGLSTKHFNVHAPIIYNKEKAKQAFEIADWNTQLGFMSKSLYCNFLNIEGELQQDCKIYKWMEEIELKKFIEGAPFFSISDRGLFRGRVLWTPVVNLLDELYPNKSRWEI